MRVSLSGPKVAGPLSPAAKAYDDPIQTQMERDHSIYVMPPGSGDIADVSALTTQQVDGFPLHPVTRTCH